MRTIGVLLIVLGIILDRNARCRHINDVAICRLFLKKRFARPFSGS